MICIDLYVKFATSFSLYFYDVLALAYIFILFYWCILTKISTVHVTVMFMYIIMAYIHIYIYTYVYKFYDCLPFDEKKGYIIPIGHTIHAYKLLLIMYYFIYQNISKYK